MSVKIERQIKREKFERARAKLAAAGTVLNGDTGTFAAKTPLGQISGAFLYDGGTLTIEVTKHPALMGRTVKGRIEKELEEA